jgi:hypothetical protein
MRSSWASRIALIGSGMTIALCVMAGARDYRARQARAAGAAAWHSAPETSHAAPAGRYPQARWRLVPPLELANTVLWVSHILIRHEGVSDTAPLDAFNWRPLGAAPKRSEAAALELARSLERELLQRPGEFARLARERSEDPITRESGGSLGGVRASALKRFPEVLDALAALKPGQASRPVKTRFGVHLFALRPPPPNEAVAARRIVIGYEEAGALAAIRRQDRPLPERSRAQALELANETALLLRRDRARFAELLAARSDASDVDAGGDIGLYTTHEAAPLAREREPLAGLEVGQVSDPVDSAWGFQIFERTSGAPRRELAAAAIQIPYLDQSEGNVPRAEALARAKRVAAELARDPGRFPALQREICCREILEWTEGRRPRSLTEGVAEIPVGTIGRTPIEVEHVFLIAKRLDPASLKQVPVSFTLPNPRAPNVLQMARTAQGPAVQKLVLRAGDTAARKLELDAGRAETFASSHQELAAMFVGPVIEEEREARLRTHLERLRALLSEQEYATYMATVETVVAATMMKL